MIWFTQTAPSRLSHALFSPSRARPDPEELVRRGTLRGVAIINGVRNQGYWCSESAVRISQIHQNLHLSSLRRILTQHLLRTHPSSQHASERTHPCSPRSQSPIITQKAYYLTQQIRVDKAKRALRGSKVGERRVEDVLEGLWRRGVLVEDGKGRVRWAICPSIRGRIRGFESLSLGGVVVEGGQKVR